jgi:SNF2 family DNA or RNA helicase
MTEASELDWSNCRLPPFDHQKVGVLKIINISAFGLFDEMGAGKTKQAIDAAQFLFTLGKIDRVLVVCPAAVRSVWFDPELGELQKHLWNNINSSVKEFHARTRTWTKAINGGRTLEWLVVNYEFIRSEERKVHLVTTFCGPRTLLILDESSAVKNHKAKQTKAALALRRACARVVLLNGTPIANSPLDMFSQGNIMDPRILACQSFFHFRARYALMGGYMQKQIKGWQNLEDMQRRFAPFVIRRLKKDCLDLPPRLPPVTLTARLTPETWHVYKQMRDDLVAFLEGGGAQQVSLAVVVIVKVLRLAQICSGILGGVQDVESAGDRPDWLPEPGQTAIGQTEAQRSSEPTVKLIGREKLDAFLEWYDEALNQDKNLKLITWVRFRPELHRVISEIKQRYPGIPVAAIYGGQKPEERQQTERFFNPLTAPSGPVFGIGTYGTGSMGLNFTAAHTNFNMSFDYALWKYEQSMARMDRPGQTHPISQFDLVAEGPNGQKTIEHNIIRSRNSKDDVATRTTSAWVQAIKEE